MTPDPTQQPDALQDAEASAEAAELSVREQLDELLIAIEQQEPGTVQSDLLPASYRLNEDGDANGSQPSPAAQPQASAEQPLEAELEAEADDVAQAMAEFEQALGPTDDSPANALNLGTDADVDDSQDELAAAPVESDRTADVGSDARAPAPSQTREPATAAEADMLAALNAALTDLGGGMKKDAPDQPAAASAAPSEQDASTNDNVDADADTTKDADVQAEIDALLSAEPISTPQSAGDDPAANASAQVDGAQPEPSTEDQIAQEIENLLSTASASPPQADPASASLANPNDDPADIGDLDKMLADEIDLDTQLDSDLAGDFQSVDAVTAGIQIDDGSKTADDPHAASARDVAAELDTQPEGVSSNDQTFDEDPFAAIAAIAEVAEKNEAEHQAQVAQTSRAKPKIDWPGLKQRINAHSLRICYAINYPARRYLTHEWRETLGLISLTVACSASLFFIAVLIFG